MLSPEPFDKRDETRDSMERRKVSREGRAARAPRKGTNPGDAIVVLARALLRDEVLSTASELGIEVRWVDAGQSPEAVADECRDAVAMIPLGGGFTTELVRECPHLELVQAVTSGTDTFDVVALAEMGVVVANNGGGNSVAVAEHTIAMMVAVFRNLRAQFDATRAGEWAAQLAPRVWPNAFELSGRTVGIVGAGNIGRQLAERLQGWECGLGYHDIREVPPELAARLGMERMSLDALLGAADVVTLHLPLTAQTRGMIGARELGLLKPTAVLVNTCRGPVVDEAALVDALRAGTLAGAALDVLADEQDVAGNPLLDMDNVVVTPHTAGMALEALHKSVVFALTNAARVVAEEPPQSVVLPE